MAWDDEAFQHIGRMPFHNLTRRKGLNSVCVSEAYRILDRSACVEDRLTALYAVYAGGYFLRSGSVGFPKPAFATHVYLP